MLAVRAPLPSNDKIDETKESESNSLKRSSSDADNTTPAKKTCTEGQQQTEERLVWSSLTFHSVDEHWQDYDVLYFQFRLCVLIKYFKVVLLWYLTVHRTHKI